MNLSCFETCFRTFSKCKLQSSVFDSNNRDTQIQSCYEQMNLCLGYVHEQTKPCKTKNTLDNSRQKSDTPKDVSPNPPTSANNDIISTSTTNSSHQTNCIFVNNNLKTLHLILLQNRCNTALKTHPTLEDVVFCNNLELYLDCVTEACTDPML